MMNRAEAHEPTRVVTKAPSSAQKGEVGRKPLAIRCIMRCVSCIISTRLLITITARITGTIITFVTSPCTV